jgi:CRP-like cAMP-binding protein
MKSIVELLSNNPVFSKLPNSKLEVLAGSAFLKHLSKGEILVHAGDVWPNLFTVAMGGIEAIKESVEGRSLIVTSFQPGDIFWGLAFFYKDLPMPVILRAYSSSQIYLWSRDEIVPLLMENGEFSWELTRLMVLNMLRASEILEQMTFQPVAGRLAKLLMETTREGTGSPVTRSLTLDEMAARIGSTREMVCRFLHRFADEGIIDITRTEYAIIDKDRLVGLAGASRG